MQNMYLKKYWYPECIPQFRNKETNNSFIFIKAKDLRDTSKRRYAMTNKRIKKYLTLLAIRICKSKPPGAAVTTTQETATLPFRDKASNAGQDMEQPQHPYIDERRMKRCNF